MRTGISGSIVGIVMSAMLMTTLNVAASANGPEPAPTPCDAATARTVAERVQARYDGIRDLRGEFSQTNESATFGGEALMGPEVKTGTVVFAKPGKMRWTYEEPEPSVVVSNGSLLWIYDVAGKSATRLEVTAGFLSGAALQFLLGDGKILETFDVSARSCTADRVALDLTPKSESTYERLGLLADPSTGDILETSVLDLFGNLTRIEFRDVVVNESPPDGLFEFVVPDGVELIEYAGAPGS